MPPSRRATIVGANLLVPAGVLFFGWNAAAAVFLVWLDMLLFSLRLGVLVFAAVSPLLAARPGTHKAGWMIGTGIGMLFVVPIFVAPPLAVGMVLHDSLAPQFPQGVLAAAFADRVIYLWIAIELAVRGFQILHRRAVGGLGVAQIGEQVLALMFRAVILIALASLASWFGRAGLVVFLFAAGAFLMYTELHENWLAQLYRHFNPSP